ncbi:MAG: 4Fe-4S dicluster domain-containing protein [Deltaproteobacteria bacterium]|nr:4Fe-4S dicluster domain-containing protein [Deltaproteobacteria bacterium]
MKENESFKEYKDRLDNALKNDFLRTAMDNFAVAYRTSRLNAFSEMDMDATVKEVAAVKANAVKNIDHLLSRFILKAEKAGIKVHLADTAENANKIIAQIAEQTHSKKIIKSKSMTAEEIHLNQWLENKGLEVTETDLGEWIVQMRKEGPSHMVMPAIHLSRYQVADLFSDVTKKHQDVKIEKLVKVARRQLRKKYIEADMGITGANFAISETGTMWITGPSECKITKGKKRQMHIVFLDNGRKKIAQDPLFAQVLQCIRCGACANVCPVYRMVGGHGLGYIYIGAIGLITTYFFHGRENAKNLVQNCTNCGACKAVCAGGIDLPGLIKEIHARIQDELGHPLKSLLLGKVLKNRKLFHTLLRTASLAQKHVRGATPYLRHLPMIFSKDHNFRVLPAITDKPFRDRFETLRSKVKNPTCKIALFSGCVQDFVYPEQLEAAMALFNQAKVQVEFPLDQSCCGLPVLMMGEKQAAKDLGLQNINAFKELNIDYIVTLCASCASHLKNHVPDLVEEYAGNKAAQFSDKVIVFSQFINKVIGIEHIRGNSIPRKTAFHSPCHLCRGLGIKDDPKKLIAKSGHEYIKTDEEETCCGFGGSFSANFPSVSKGILTRKLDDVEKSGADLLVTECPGCVMQLRGGALKQKRNIEVKHLSQIIQPSGSSST